jgi:hypothetical protein
VFTLLAINFFLMGITMLSVGIAGEYVGRIYRKCGGDHASSSEPSTRENRRHAASGAMAGRKRRKRSPSPALSAERRHAVTEREPRVVVFAYSEVGTRCLETLLRLGAHVVGVFTHEDDPKETIWFRSVAQTAREAGLPVLFGPPTEERVRALRPDLLFSFYYRDMIGESILRLPGLGAFNMHGSLLPKYRGRARINWAVRMVETETGRPCTTW